MKPIHPVVARRRNASAIAIRVVAAGLLSATLAGCYTPAARVTEDFYPVDYRQRHPISVSEGNHDLKVFIGNNRAGLTPVQRAEVLAFAGTWRREATSGVVVEVPTGASNSAAARDSVREIRSLLAAAGVPNNGLTVRPYQPSGPDEFAPIKLNYAKVVAQVGPCGLWPHDVGPSFDRTYNENKPYWNLGCAAQRNIAAMVTNPADLVQPRAVGAVYQARRTTVLEKYRAGDATVASDPNANKGKISDIGK
jgi:pilus assembly protein CpaD